MKRVFVYDKDEETLRFLRDFFRTRPQYEVQFFSRVDVLRKELRDHPPFVVLTGGGCCLDRVNPTNTGAALIALIGDEVTGGMQQVVKHGVQDYIISPFHGEDLEYKLALCTRKIEDFRTLYQEKEDVRAVSELTYILSSTLDPKEILYLIVKKLSELMPVNRCSILSMQSAKDRTVDVLSTFEDPTLRHLTLKLSKYPEVAKAVRTQQPVIVENATKDPLMKSVSQEILRLKIRAIMVIPIVFRGEVIGTLFLRTSRKTHVFTEREIMLCKTVADAAANALNTAYLFEEIKSERAELERLAITDFLTGVYNLRYLYHRLDTEFSRASRYRSPLSCLMLDIDFFKRVNDTYGHRAGDIVLREFATLIRNHTRKSDIFSRYGGEEFILVMPQTSPRGAITEARRLCGVVRGHRFKGLKRSSRITVSVGVASFPSPDIKDPESLIHASDDALMKAKEAGRDTIAVHEMKRPSTEPKARSRKALE